MSGGTLGRIAPEEVKAMKVKFSARDSSQFQEVLGDQTGRRATGWRT